MPILDRGDPMGPILNGITYIVLPVSESKRSVKENVPGEWVWSSFGYLTQGCHIWVGSKFPYNSLTWHDQNSMTWVKLPKFPWLFTDLEKILFFPNISTDTWQPCYIHRKKKELDICLFIMWTTISTSVNEIVWLSISTCADLSPVFTHSSQLCKLSISYITLLANLSHVNPHCTCTTGMNISMILFVQHAFVSSI